MRKFLSKRIYLSFLTLVYGSSFVLAQPTITNAGFETGDYTGWTTSNASKTAIDGNNQYEGTSCLWLKGPQNIRTTITGLTAETDYLVSIYVTHPDYGEVENFKAFLIMDDNGSDVKIDSVTVDSSFNQLSAKISTGADQTEVTIGLLNGGFFHAFYDLLEVNVYVSVSGIALDIEKDTLIIEETLQLTATVEPAEATDKSVMWSSSDENIATVDETGLVTAVASGSAIITVETNDGSFSSTCEIIVEELPGGITIENPGFETGDYTGWTTSNAGKTAIDIVNQYEGANCLWLKGPQNIRTTITGLTPETEYAVSIYVTHPDYGLSDGYKALLFIDEDGSNMDIDSVIIDSSFSKLAAKITTGAGQTEVTVGVRNSGFFHGFYDLLEVSDYIAATSVSLDITKDTLEIADTLQLIATVDPTEASVKSVTWSSSDEAVATVSEFGLVKAISAGNAIITVTSNDGSFTATCEIAVNQTVGINLSTINLKIYPNPVTDVLNIASDEKISSIQVTNILGGVQNIIAKEESNITSLDVSSLSSGIYFISIHFNNGVIHTEQLVK